MRVFGIDPGSSAPATAASRPTVGATGSSTCGAITAPARAAFPAAPSRHSPRAGGAPRRVPSRLRRHREPVSRQQRAQRAEARARARRRDAGRRRSRVSSSSSTRRPKSSARSSATAAPRSTQVQQMVKLLLGLSVGAVAARRRRRAGGRDLPRAPSHARAPDRHGRPIAARELAQRSTRGSRHRRSWRRLAQARRTMIAFLRGRLLEKHPNRVIVDVNGVGYDVQVPAVDVLRARRAGGRGVASHPHARPRRRHRALRIRDRARAGAVRAADRGQRHRSEGSRWRCSRASSRPSSCGRSSAATSPGSPPFPASARRPPSAIVLELKDRSASLAVALAGGRSSGSRGRRAARRPALGAAEPGVSSAARRKSRRPRARAGT